MSPLTSLDDSVGFINDPHSSPCRLRMLLYSTFFTTLYGYDHQNKENHNTYKVRCRYDTRVVRSYVVKIIIFEIWFRHNLEGLVKYYWTLKIKQRFYASRNNLIQNIKYYVKIKKK